QLSASGPSFLPNTVYLVSGRRYVYDDYLLDTLRFTPWMTRSGSPDDKARAPDGDGSTEPLGYSHEWSGIAKLTNRSIPHLELGYQAILNDVRSRRADWNFRLDPEGLTRQHTVSVAHGLDVTHTLSKSSYYNVSLRQNYFDYKDLAYDDVYDPRYDRAGP